MHASPLIDQHKRKTPYPSMPAEKTKNKLTPQEQTRKTREMLGYLRKLAGVKSSECNAELSHKWDQPFFHSHLVVYIQCIIPSTPTPINSYFLFLMFIVHSSPSHRDDKLRSHNGAFALILLANLGSRNALSRLHG